MFNKITVMRLVLIVCINCDLHYYTYMNLSKKFNPSFYKEKLKYKLISWSILEFSVLHKILEHRSISCVDVSIYISFIFQKHKVLYILISSVIIEKSAQGTNKDQLISNHFTENLLPK